MGWELRVQGAIKVQDGLPEVQDGYKKILR